MSDILEDYPEYAKTSSLDALREIHYAHLDRQGHTYLDYTGAGLSSVEQHRVHATRLASTSFGNPHSESPTSKASTALVENTRARILAHLRADPADYVVIFTPNATGAARLVAEAYPFRRRSRLVLTCDNHNSVNGIREYAHRRGAKTVYISCQTPSLRVDTSCVERGLRPRWKVPGERKKRGLFAYPAQSNFSGVQHPLAWVQLAQQNGYDVLLDAAAYLPTKILDLSVTKPEFVMVSWYKVFGYPTGVGCLVVKKDAMARLERPWFSGGTVAAAFVGNGAEWHVQQVGEAGYEDGTVNFLSIPDVAFGLNWVTGIGMDLIQLRVRCLTGWFLDRLLAMRHSDGLSMVRLYGPDVLEARGGTICFNFVDAAGSVVDDRLVGLEAAVEGISLRTGCFCNPGAGAAAFGVDGAALRRIKRLRPGLRPKSTDDMTRMLGLRTSSAVRVSFGLASTTLDVEKFMSFAETSYRDRVVTESHIPRDGC
ncbi:molybdenum cofactor sulfurase [Verticillium alfalfae VaMs.102]|uniref:Molybdenum cofactor sulfurase n=1 Tax=Verticillium alfalfae (strain VaMs.102 / ATCC MYA-4576 / FGSC 10136) TaxID=526221 RepID=C9SRE5_VERA1|nr:molybdenum cofactor sulfurase [Verticillium alfalfae VaMs.102]EEY21360.1 molybdenum cofactor sulfurase [Verticillium alfalfae VaMs.102]